MTFTCSANALIAGIGMIAARKNPEEFVIDVRVILGPTLRKVFDMSVLIGVYGSALLSSSKNSSAITNMSSTPNPRTRNGST